MKNNDNSISQVNTRIFETTGKVLKGNKIYLVERHFAGNRDFRQAVFTVVGNEAKRMNQAKESA